MLKSLLRGFDWWSAAAIFLGAFLLFQVQPIISKMILPWFGGSPAVWSTCMLFFQALLLAGYAYAHLVCSMRTLGRQAAVHAALLLAAVALLPITPGESWKPTGGEDPTWRILALLLASVGLPYFLLASTGPLVQSWFARVYPHRSPYRLYALSNVGSLGALLSYPVLFEPALATPSQGMLWSGVFLVFAVLCGSLGGVLWKTGGVTAPTEHTQPGEKPPPAAKYDKRKKKKRPPQQIAPEAAPRKYDWVLWLALPMLASTMLLAVTHHICRDVAVAPFLWIAPLSLYLLSFIICFERDRWYARIWWSLAAAAMVLAACNLMLAGHLDDLYAELGLGLKLRPYRDDATTQAVVYFVLLFLVCMVCHGETVRRKPPSGQLTKFYLFIATGGALGGMLVAIICPLVMVDYFELNLSLVAAYLVSIGVLLAATWSASLRESGMLRLAAGAFAVAGMFVVAWAQLDAVKQGSIAVARNFYGVLRVSEHYQDTPNHGRAMFNGNILHGYQYLAPQRRREPTTYFDRQSGLGTALARSDRGAPRRIGVIGLGMGTIACYGQTGDVMRFYEINPQVIDFAKEYFTFLEDCPADVKIVLGDARLSMEREPPQKYDVLVLDAFSGDAIPTHLVTTEAFALYLQHLSPDGVIAAHVSNRYLRIEDVLAAQADHFGLTARYAVSDDTDEDNQLADAPSAWLVMTTNQQFLNDSAVLRDTVAVKKLDNPPRWTDRFSNLLQVLRQKGE